VPCTEIPLLYTRVKKEGMKEGTKEGRRECKREKERNWQSQMNSSTSLSRISTFYIASYCL